MNIIFHEANGIRIAELISDNIEIKNTQDALDIMVNCNYQEAINLIWHKKNIIDDFFTLRTGIAGDILQKFSNYKNRLAIVGDFKNNESKSLRDFIIESNKTGRINFVSSVKEAIEILSKEK
jgi:hypothetical protein